MFCSACSMHGTEGTLHCAVVHGQQRVCRQSSTEGMTRLHAGCRLQLVATTTRIRQASLDQRQREAPWPLVRAAPGRPTVHHGDMISFLDHLAPSNARRVPVPLGLRARNSLGAESSRHGPASHLSHKWPSRLCHGPDCRAPAVLRLGVGGRRLARAAYFQHEATDTGRRAEEAASRLQLACNSPATPTASANAPAPASASASATGPATGPGPGLRPGPSACRRTGWTRAPSPIAFAGPRCSLDRLGPRLPCPSANTTSAVASCGGVNRACPPAKPGRFTISAPTAALTLSRPCSFHLSNSSEPSLAPSPPIQPGATRLNVRSVMLLHIARIQHAATASSPSSPFSSSFTSCHYVF